MPAVWTCCGDMASGPSKSVCTLARTALLLTFSRLALRVGGTHYEVLLPSATDAVNAPVEHLGFVGVRLLVRQTALAAADTQAGGDEQAGRRRRAAAGRGGEQVQRRERQMQFRRGDGKQGLRPEEVLGEEGALRRRCARAPLNTASRTSPKQRRVGGPPPTGPPRSHARGKRAATTSRSRRRPPTCSSRRQRLHTDARHGPRGRAGRGTPFTVAHGGRTRSTMAFADELATVAGDTLTFSRRTRPGSAGAPPASGRARYADTAVCTCMSAYLEVDPDTMVRFAAGRGRRRQQRPGARRRRPQAPAPLPQDPAADLQAIAWPVNEGRVDMAAFQRMADHLHRPPASSAGHARPARAAVEPGYVHIELHDGVSHCLTAHVQPPTLPTMSSATSTMRRAAGGARADRVSLTRRRPPRGHRRRPRRPRELYARRSGGSSKSPECPGSLRTSTSAQRQAGPGRRQGATAASASELPGPALTGPDNPRHKEVPRP